MNIQNSDNACFAWSITAALNGNTRNCERTSSYPHYSTILNWAGISFPVALKNIHTFENNNNISVNVYGYNHQNMCVE